MARGSGQRRSVLQGGQRRRGRRGAVAGAPRPRRGRRWLHGLLALVLVVVLTAAGLELLARDDAGSPRDRASRVHASLIGGPGSAAAGRASKPHRLPPVYGRLRAPASERVHVRFKQPPVAALLWDVHTGRVLWSRHATRPVPIASLTKMMTSLLVVDSLGPGEGVKITDRAVHYQGSGVGNLPKGKKIAAETLLYGLLLPSGNDAALALAQRVGGSVEGFVKKMNRRAQRMNLPCTHYSTPSGFLNRGNRSCAADLAVIAHAMLQRPRIARIISTASIALPAPVKGKKLFLYNNNPLLRLHYPGTDGVKTGYTASAGRCLVATARRGNRHLGVVLLHSVDPPDQARQLLDLGFRKLG